MENKIKTLSQWQQELAPTLDRRQHKLDELMDAVFESMDSAMSAYVDLVRREVADAVLEYNNKHNNKSNDKDDTNNNAGNS